MLQGHSVVHIAEGLFQCQNYVTKKFCGNQEVYF